MDIDWASKVGVRPSPHRASSSTYCNNAVVVVEARYHYVKRGNPADETVVVHQSPFILGIQKTDGYTRLYGKMSPYYTEYYGIVEQERVRGSPPPYSSDHIIAASDKVRYAILFEWASNRKKARLFA